MNREVANPGMPSTGWCSGPLLPAGSRRLRRQGLRPAAGPFGLVMAGRSVHTFGMAAPLGVVFVSRGGRVLVARTVLPGRIATCLRARLVLEVPPHVGLPAPGAVLVVERRGGDSLPPNLATWSEP